MAANDWRADLRVGPNFRRGCAVAEKNILSRSHGAHGEISRRDAVALRKQKGANGRECLEG